MKDYTFPAAGSFQIVRPIQCYFEPQPDITAYELAKLLPYLLPREAIYEEDWRALGDGLTRHLKRVAA